MIAPELSYYPPADRDAERQAEHARLRDDMVGDLGRIAILTLSAGITESQHSHDLPAPSVEQAPAPQQSRPLGSFALEQTPYTSELLTPLDGSQYRDALRAAAEQAV